MAKGQKTGGRTKGTPNKATADVKAAAQKYTPGALRTLAAIMRSSESDAARVAAAKELLDRGHGKAPQDTTTTIRDDRLVARMPTPSKDAEGWVSEHGPVH